LPEFDFLGGGKIGLRIAGLGRAGLVSLVLDNDEEVSALLIWSARLSDIFVLKIPAQGTMYG
jgi:S1-C subfamily serine protease